MQRILRLASRILFALAVMATIAVTVLYALAFNSLAQGGPNLHGYGLLDAGNHGVVVVAVLAVLVVCTGFAYRPVVVPAGTLALASGIVGGLAVGVRTLALFLSHVDQHSQPPALNAFILAIAGSAQDVAPAAVVLAVGAATLVVIRGIRKTSRTRVVGDTGLEPMTSSV